MTSIIKYSPKVIGEILNIVHNSVFLLNAENRILFANSQMEKMFKANAEQLIDLQFEKLFMPEDREIMAPNFLKITKEKREFECETMLRCLDDTSFLGLMCCAYFQWEGEGLIAATIHDITKMKSIERMLKLSEHDTFLGRMLDDISHHIRNPVLVIGGLAKRLSRGEETEKYAEIISNESRRLEKLLDTLNAFIKLPRPQLKHVSLAELVRMVEQCIKPIIEEHEITWKYKYSEKILSNTMLIDLALLLKAIEAVVLNACEAYKERNDTNTVTLQLLETFEPSWPYAVKVIDKGCGINEKDLPNITSHFFTKKSKHIGMGLTFAQRIMDEHDGELTIDSSKDKGTTVTFFLKRERRRSIRTKKL
ncbi:ATP-binding protein [Thermodesulfobacteriota bacterium]